MEPPRDPNREITQRFCPAKGQNMLMEVSILESGGRSVRCLNEENCLHDRGACENCLREYWR